MGSSQGSCREAPPLEVRPGLALWQGPGASAFLELDGHPMYGPTDAMSQPRIDASVGAADEVPLRTRDDVRNREDRFVLLGVPNLQRT